MVTLKKTRSHTGLDKFSIVESYIIMHVISQLLHFMISPKSPINEHFHPLSTQTLNLQTHLNFKYNHKLIRYNS